MRTFLLLLFTFLSFQSQGQTVYVNHAATGANNGTSWTDAYTSLQTAITSINTSSQTVWIAAGTYKPSSSDRTASFVIDDVATTLYGGFNGTETTLSQRDLSVNQTILSGDLSGNDDVTISFTNSLRSENSYNVLKINASNSVLDGIIISDGHANGTAATSSGAAIYKLANVANLTIRNCEFKNNVSYNGGACVHAEYTISGTLLIENTKHINNIATYATAYHVFTNTLAITVNVNIKNSLFDGNKAIDNGATKGYAGSAGWFRAYNANTTINANFTNNTYVNNIDTGTNTYVLNRATIGLSKNGSASSSLYGNVYNCIFWNNTGISNATSVAVNNISDAPTSALTAYNSLDVNNFSTIATKQNIITSNPLFVSSTNFQLMSTSPAINTGNNTYVDTTTDLAGNARIVNSTVDMGAYEYGDLCGFLVTAITENTANVSWNSAISTDLLYVVAGQPIASGTTVTGLTTNSTVLSGLIQNTNYELYSSATCSSISSSGWYLVNTFKTKGAIYVNHAATGAGNGSSWANAYTTLGEALLNVTPTYYEIRVAQGTYKPNAAGLSSSKLATFLIPNGAKIYGGFNGTETTLAQRDPKVNITILNGDINGNDNSTIMNTNSLRSDNSFHVISLIGQVTAVVIDGFTISGGNATVVNNANYSTEGYGGAIFSNPGSMISAQIKNCIIEKNTGTEAGVYGQYATPLVTNTTIDFKDCIIRNNQSSGTYANIQMHGYSGVSFGSQISQVTYGSFQNCLFYDNVSNGPNNQGASCISVYQSATAGGAYNTAYVSIVNCTFSNNWRTNGGQVLSFLLATNASLINSIIYNNNGGSTASLYLHGSDPNYYPTGINNIIHGGQLGGVNANPLFVGGSNYQLTAGSPAINTGANVYVNSLPTDLAGNPRIVGGTVDKGAYEYDAALSATLFASFSNFTMYPNPATSEVYFNSKEDIKSIEIYSLEGKLIINSQDKTIDVSDLQSGIYLVKVMNSNNEIGIKKLIKK